MPGRKAVVIRDEIEGIPADRPVVWNMTTRADIDLIDQGSKAALKLGGQTLLAQLQVPDAVFRVVDANPSMDMENPNKGYRRLQVEIESKGTPLVIEVAFFPEEPVQLKQAPLDHWRE